MFRSLLSDTRHRPPLRQAAVALGAALLAVAVGSAPPLATRAAADAGASSLTKTVSDVNRPGRPTADHGDTLNWAVGYHNAATGGPSPVTITDPVQGAGAAQSYVPGSLHVPPGWTPSWSTDGTSFGPADQGAATVAVRASHPAVSGAGTSLRGDLLPPVQAAARSTGGDGFTPILYRAPSGDVEAWNIYHHTGPAAPIVVCNDLSTGEPCAGGPWPRPLNTTAGPLGSGATGDVYSPLTPQYVTDPARPGTVYYPAVTASSVGVGCLDMSARANCGYVPLLASDGASSRANGLAGIVAVGGEVYGVASTGQVLCMELADRAPCAGQPFAAIVPANHDLPGSTYALYQGAMVTAAGKVFASSAPQTASTVNGPPALGCFDPATGAVCAGWTTPHPAGSSNGQYTYNAFAAYDAGGAPTKVCTTDSGGVPATFCYALDGTPAAPAATGLDSLPSGTLVFNPEVVAAGGDTRSYFAVWGGPLPGDTLCWSWTHAQPCAGFPAPAGHPSVNGGTTRDYGYAYDATTRCLIGLGDAGVLFSMDPATGASPCVHSGASVTLSPADFYCDGAAGHVRGYTRARLEDFDVSHADLADSHVSVTDPDGAVVAAPPLEPDGSVDLTGVSAAQHPSITVTVQLVLTGTGDFTDTNHPGLTVAFEGDDPQVCLRTVVAADCGVTKVADAATGSDGTGAFTSPTVSLDVDPGELCGPHVSVNKEVCVAPGPSPHCSLSGGGPWAKAGPVGLTHLPGVVQWRITVANSGPMGALGVTVNDPAEPGCHFAAGVFDLPAGASRQVYCSSVVNALPFTNTASATFLPARGPAGTVPATSKPSSAVACSQVCVLAGDGHH
ncbi:hypothetical protein [Streptomyces sp. NBC_01190]|uniref:DUF7617 domain-containing protein n=1 Tax=Streptomyces sp. NBC_01190 TaxID=2903767 RepID=UPI00386DFEE6|nr:DUF11 domain-containing protein [Streptomyces sp. NBC_01190]